MTYRINNDKSAAVSTEDFYLPISSCPKGVKVVALSEHFVARIDIYSNQKDLIGWYPLPKIPPELKQV
jgi:hypothetical protein